MQQKERRVYLPHYRYKEQERRNILQQKECHIYLDHDRHREQDMRDNM